MKKEINLSREDDDLFWKGIIKGNFLFLQTPYESYTSPPKHLIDSYGNQIIHAKPERIPLTSEGLVDIKGLRKIVEENKGHTKLLIRNPEDDSYICCLELPRVAGSDPYVREVIFD